jgi:hypothetical protein
LYLAELGLSVLSQVRISSCDLYHNQQRSLSLLERKHPTLMMLGARDESRAKAAIMENDDFVTCPLCNGLSQMRRSELLASLRAQDLREKLEGHIDQLTPVTEVVQTAPGPGPGEFAQEVHHWNAERTLWRRSAKE